MKKLIAAFVIALAAILAARLSFFTVEEGRAALVLGWNKSVSAEVTEPGLHVKLPDPIERTAMIDCRGQSLQVSALEPKGEGSIPTLGYDVVWRVVKPELWWKEFKGSGDQTAREITQAVQTASAGETAGLNDASLITRGGVWISSQVMAKVAPEFLKRGVRIESVRVAEVRLNAKSQASALDATAKILNGQVQASGHLVEESASEIRAAADAKARQTLSAALSRAAQMKSEADAAANANYQKIDRVTGIRDFSSALEKARSEEKPGEKLAPMPDFRGLPGGTKP